MADLKRFNSSKPKQLASDLTSSGTTLKLTEIVDWGGTNDLTAAQFSDYIPATIINDARTTVEFVLLTASTIANYATTGITIYKRGLKYYAEGDSTDDDEVTANKLAWPAGTTKVLLGTNPPNMYGHLANKANDESVTGKWTFDDANRPNLDADTDASDDKALVTFGQLNRVATGTTSIDRVVPVAVAGETIASGKLVYYDSTEEEWMVASSATAAKSENVVLGIAQGAGTDGVAITGGVLLTGLDAKQTGLTPGTLYYLSDTPGSLSLSTGTKNVPIGYACSATQIYFTPNFNRLPTKDIQDALAGTSGVPTALNKYITEDDVKADYVDQSQTTQDASVACGEADATSKYNSIAQQFTAGETSISGVRLWKEADDGSFTGTVTVRLYADNGSDDPIGSALASILISNATWLALTDGEEFTAIFGTAYTTVVGTKYWIRISTSTADNTNFINLGTNSAGGYADGSVDFNNTADGYVAIATIDLYFKTLTIIADKVARRDSNGDVIVTTTPTDGDAATSKDYVDGKIDTVEAKLILNAEQTLDVSKDSQTASTVSLVDFCTSDDGKSIYIYTTNSSGAIIARYLQDTTTGLFYYKDKVAIASAVINQVGGVTYYNEKIYAIGISSAPAQSMIRYDEDLTNAQVITISGGTQEESALLANDGATFFTLDTDDTTGGKYTLAGTTLTRVGDIAAITGAYDGGDGGSYACSLNATEDKLTFGWNDQVAKDTELNVTGIVFEEIVQAGGAATEIPIVNNLDKYVLGLIPVGDVDATEYIVISMNTPGTFVSWNSLNIKRISKSTLGL